jgi:hypothetical protein
MKNYIKLGKGQRGTKSINNIMVIGSNPAKPKQTISVHFKRETNGSYTCELHSCENFMIDMPFTIKLGRKAWSLKQRELIDLYGVKYGVSGALYLTAGKIEKARNVKTILIELGNLLVNLSK